MGTASTVGEEAAVVAVKARQLGSPCCFACRAALVKTMAMAKAKAKFAAPPGASKVAVGSGSLFRSSSCGHRVRTADQLVCARVSASASVNILQNASCSIDIYYVAHIDYILYIGGLKGKESSSSVYSYNSCGRASSPAPIVVMGIKNASDAPFKEQTSFLLHTYWGASQTRMAPSSPTDTKVLESGAICRSVMLPL
jgi:hypothetical protein